MVEPKYLPLIGVAVGWLLSEISAAYRGRGEQRKAVGLALARILQLDARITALIDVLESMKDLASSWSEYEGLRQHCVQRYVETDDQLLKQAADAVPIIAAIMPLEAMQIQGMYEARVFTKRVKFSSAANNTDAYIKWISVMEAADEVTRTELRKIALTLARTHGMLTWWRVRQFMAGRDQVREKNRGTMKKLFIDEYKESRRCSGEKPIPNSSSPAEPVPQGE